MGLSLLLILSSVLTITVIYGVTIPPKIIKQGPKDIFFKPGETVKIECVASGMPAPSYHWKRAEVDFSPSGNDQRVVISKDSGTLFINSPEDKDEGLYQCLAVNDYGTASTIKFNLREAKLKEFITTSPIYHRPQLGSPIKLNCQSPDSVPDADIYWVIIKDHYEYPVFWDQRVTMDYEDRLHFTNVQPEDASQDGTAYHCVAYNRIMRKSVVGPPQYILPSGSNAVLTSMAKAWPTSRFDEKGLVGSDFRMKCIFSGNPTPTVRWKRKDNQKFNSRVQMGNSGGQELIIKNLQVEDAGTYLCDGTRDQEQTAMEMSINLNVDAAPEWVKEPEDVSIGEGGTAEFSCLAVGDPLPRFFWFVNGEPLEDALRNDKRLDSRFHHLKDNQIVLQDVTKNDAMVFQCNVSNIHGYLWGEAFLNVLEEAPTILKRPDNVVVAEGQPFNIQCYIVGKPDPIITWYKDGIQVTGGRFIVEETGGLFVQTAVLSDAGEYRCHAENKYGQQEATGQLVVRRKTVIEWRPMDLEVQRKVNAKFTCSGTTDPEEITNLRTIWMKDYKPVELGERMFLNTQDHSLTISGPEQEDSGTYTCVVTNGLDNDTASARLVVTDLPDQPYNIRVNNTCTSFSKTEILWTAGSFNNAPIQYFTVEYETTTDPNHWVFAAKVHQTLNSAFIPLRPGLNYKFRVTAYNKIGASAPSESSNSTCRTTVGKPTQNPSNLRTIGDKPGQVHVEWTPVPPDYQGGGNFSYTITLRKVGDPDTAIKTQDVMNWRVSEWLFPHTGSPYQPYEITIMSRNSEGDHSPATRVIGFSDEAIPNIKPFDLELLEVLPDAMVLQWKFERREIGRLNTRIRGEFRGFKIQFWEENRKSETIRDVDIPPEELDMNTTLDTFNATVRHLMPNTRMAVRVSVINNFFVSAPTEPIDFATPPGLPGPVRYMEDMNMGDNHVNLRWDPPLDSRGDLLGYDIGYCEVDGLRVGEMQERNPQIDDPYATTAMLTGLLPNTKYRIYIWARSSAGRGEEYFIERTTKPSGYPRIPRFTISGVGSNFINVSWWRDAYLDSGTIVYVQYKKEDGAEWFSTTPDVSKDWVNLPRLESGILYNIRIVVTTGETRRLSEIEDVTTDGTAKAYDLVSNLGWFLGMIFAILLFIGVVLGFVICYRRGFRFKRAEEEDSDDRREGEETYTGTHYNKTPIPRHSQDFGPPPKGYSNDYYKDQYEMDEYGEGEGGFESDRNRRDNYGDDRGYDEYYDHDYPPQDEYGDQNRENDERGRLGSHEYEDYDMDPDDARASEWTASAGVRGSRESLSRGAQADLNSSRDSRSHYSSGDNRQDRYREPARAEARRPDYRTNDYPDDYRRDHHYKRRQDEEPSHSGSSRDPRYADRPAQRIHHSRHHHHHHQSPPQDHEHRDHHNDPDHDHQKCKDVVDQFKRYSGGETSVEAGGAIISSGTTV